MSFRFQFRRGTTAERDAANPILAAGEPAVVLDSGQPAELVLGDGVTAMADLRRAAWGDDTRLALAGTAVQPAALATKADDQGANLSRFIHRCRAGRPVKIVAIGDSILLGTTVTADGGTLGTDDALSVVRDAVATRFGNTATAVNHALSGHTVATGPLSVKWSAAVTEDADLYLIDYGTNDLSGDLTSAPVPGYPINASMAGLERLFRRLRSDVPKADIAFLIANPYAGGTDAGNNPAKRAWSKRVADVCAAYGVELIDGYAPFIAAGDYSALMADSTHPNSAGHALLAATIMEHLPAAFQGPARLPAVMPRNGLHDPQNVDTTFGDTGVLYYLIPTAPMWVETGTWADDGASRSTSTVGSKIGGTANFTELYAMIDTLDATGLHATLKIDGVDVFTAQDMTTGKNGTYWVPLVTGLAPGVHTYEFILTAGTMKVDRVGWLVGAANVGVTTYNDGIVFQTLGSGTTLTTVPTDGSVVKIVDTTVTLPAGWGSADVFFRGYINHRVTGVTTTIRRFNVGVRLNGTVIDSQDFSVAPVAENTYTPPVTLSTVKGTLTTSRLVSLESRLFSTDKTLCSVSSWSLEAMLIRRT